MYTDYDLERMSRLGSAGLLKTKAQPQGWEAFMAQNVVYRTEYVYQLLCNLVHDQLERADLSPADGALLGFSKTLTEAIKRYFVTLFDKTPAFELEVIHTTGTYPETLRVEFECIDMEMAVRYSRNCGLRYGGDSSLRA